jgi:hypothetical protein
MVIDMTMEEEESDMVETLDVLYGRLGSVTM